MRVKHCAVVSLFAAFAIAGCGDAPEEKTGALDQWLGDAPHFAVSGTFNGKPMNIRLEGAAASHVRCTRNYAPLPGTKPDAEGKYDTSQLYFVMKEIGIVTDVEGLPTDVSIGYWRYDPAAGTNVDVVPRQRGSTIPEGKTWVDFELSEPNATGPNGVEKAAESGTLSMKLNSGTPDQNGIFIPTGGRTGEFAALSWGPEENLKVSVTSDCQDAEIVMWGPSVVAP